MQICKDTKGETNAAWHQLQIAGYHMLGKIPRLLDGGEQRGRKERRKDKEQETGQREERRDGGMKNLAWPFQQGTVESSHLLVTPSHAAQILH